MGLNNLTTKLNKKIAILGAGPMGLATAYYLIKKGYRPHIYEADDRVGGMAASFNFNGVDIERFYHFHCTSDDAYFDMLEDLNLTHKFHWVKTKMGFFYNKLLQAWGNPIALIRFKGIPFLDKLRYGIHVFYSVKKTKYQDLDQIEAVNWIKKWLGERGYRSLWEKLFTYKFYNLSEQISAAWIWARIRRIGRSRYNLMHEKLGYLEGGSQTLLDAMVKFIETNGGQIHLKRPIQEVIIEQNQVKGVRVNNERIDYDDVISTIPVPYIPYVIPNLAPKIIKQFKSIQNVAVVCVIVKLKKPVSSYFWVNVNDHDMDIPGFVEFTNLMPMKDSIVYMPFYMPQNEKKFNDKDDIFKNKAKQYLMTVSKNLADNDITEMHVSRLYYAQPVCTVNFLSKLPPINCGIKNLKVADTSYYYPEDRGISESFKFARKNLADEIS